MRFHLVHQLELGIRSQRPHEGIRHADRQVEIAEAAIVLGGDETLNIRMINAQYAHLRAASRASRFNGLAGSIEHFHVRHRPRSTRLRALHLRPSRTDSAEIVAHAATAAHGLCSLRHGRVNTRQAIIFPGHRIAHRLHEAVHQGSLQAKANGGIDTSGRHKAVLLRPQEFFFKVFAQFRRLQRSQCARYAAADVDDVLLIPLRVFFAQHVQRDFLGRHGVAEHFFVCIHG
jgi:hypothetical protein